jgi:hypothetical protein
MGWLRQPYDRVKNLVSVINLRELAFSRCILAFCGEFGENSSRRRHFVREACEKDATASRNLLAENYQV